MAIGNIMGGKIAAARAGMTPPLSRKNFLEKLQASGVDLSQTELEALEAGKHALNYYQISVVASVLNMTARDLMVP